VADVSDFWTGLGSDEFGGMAPALSEPEETAKMLPGAAASMAKSFAAPYTDLASLAHDAAQGNWPQPILTDSGYEWPEGTSDPYERIVRDTLGMATSGIGSAPEGALGMFVGRHAFGSDLKALAEAQKFQAMGADPNILRQMFNWEPWYASGDAHSFPRSWRSEISDKDAQLIPGTTSVGGSKRATTLGQVIDAPDLFRAYPDLPHMPFDPYPQAQRPGMAGYAVPGLKVGMADPPQTGGLIHAPKGTLLHEIAHLIQHKEGWAQGTSPSMMIKSPHFDAYARNIISHNPHLQKLPFDQARDAIANNIYWRSAGEKSARDVEDRMDYTRAQQHDYDPSSSIFNNPPHRIDHMLPPATYEPFF
jgi:hypothetical protein